MFWISTINWMTVYMIIFQLLMIGLFALKEMNQINVVTVPLPIFTMILHMFIKSLFTSKYTHMTLETLQKIPTASRDQLQVFIFSRINERFRLLRKITIFVVKYRKKDLLAIIPFLNDSEDTLTINLTLKYLSIWNPFVIT